MPEMARTAYASAFDSAVIRSLRDHGIDDVSPRALEDWRACGGVWPPPTPRLRGYRPHYVAPATHVERVVEFRALIRGGVGRQLASLRLFVRHGEKASPAQARALAALRPELLDRARRDEGLVPYPEELREAMSARSRSDLSAEVFAALDDGPVLVGYRNEDPAKPSSVLRVMGSCRECGRDVYLWPPRGSAGGDVEFAIVNADGEPTSVFKPLPRNAVTGWVGDALARGAQLMCNQCAH